MSAGVDVLIPTYRRPGALAVTLAGLAGQTRPPTRVIVSDQSPDRDGAGGPEVDATVRLVELRGSHVERRSHLPRRGLAEHRQSLLHAATADYVLFLDDDVWMLPDLLARLMAAIERARCGFVGSAVIGLSYRHDVRPDEQVVEFWDGPPRPETVRPGTPAWRRHVLHNAANLLHLRQRLRPSGDRLYKVAWIGGCVLYDRAVLERIGGFDFWRDLPADHSGEDALAQMRVMQVAGGAGLFPSGAFHLELPTTVTGRSVDAPVALAGGPPDRASRSLAARSGVP